MTCGVPRCERTIRAAGLCDAHYQRLRDSGSVRADDPVQITGDDERRFWSKVHRTEGCWLWVGYVANHGYGVMNIGRRVVYAHRYAWGLIRGEIPPATQIHHLCHERRCVNPDHLELMSAATHARHHQREHAPTHCPQGHPYDEENTGRVRSGKKAGARYCKACNRARVKAHRLAQRAQLASGSSS